MLIACSPGPFGAQGPLWSSPPSSITFTEGAADTFELFRFVSNWDSAAHRIWRDPAGNGFSDASGVSLDPLTGIVSYDGLGTAGSVIISDVRVGTVEEFLEDSWTLRTDRTVFPDLISADNHSYVFGSPEWNAIEHFSAQDRGQFSDDTVYRSGGRSAGSNILPTAGSGARIGLRAALSDGTHPMYPEGWTFGTGQVLETVTAVRVSPEYMGTSWDRGNGRKIAIFSQVDHTNLTSSESSQDNETTIFDPFNLKHVAAYVSASDSRPISVDVTSSGQSRPNLQPAIDNGPAATNLLVGDPSLDPSDSRTQQELDDAARWGCLQHYRNVHDFVSYAPDPASQGFKFIPGERNPTNPWDDWMYVRERTEFGTMDGLDGTQDTRVTVWCWIDGMADWLTTAQEFRGMGAVAPPPNSPNAIPGQNGRWCTNQATDTVPAPVWNTSSVSFTNGVPVAAFNLATIANGQFWYTEDSVPGQTFPRIQVEVRDGETLPPGFTLTSIDNGSTLEFDGTGSHVFDPATMFVLRDMYSNPAIIPQGERQTVTMWYGEFCAYAGAQTNLPIPGGEPW